MDDDLSLVSTDDLLDELSRRFQDGVFVARSKRDDIHDAARYDYWGDYHVCMGLCQLAMIETHRRWEGRVKERKDT